MRRLALLLLACPLVLAAPAGADAPGIAQPTLRLVTPSAALPTGGTATVEVHADGVRAGTPLRWYRAGPNPTNGVLHIDGTSVATLPAWTSHSPGEDIVVAWADLDGDGLEDAGEPYASTTIRWHVSETYLAPGIETATELARLTNPRRYRHLNVEAVNGRVRVQLPPRPGAAPSGPFRRLAAAAQIPAGALIDARNGKVLLEAAAPGATGRERFGSVGGGFFTLRQSRAGVELALARGSFARACRSGRNRLVRRLRGTGPARILGRHSTTTAIRGTWVVEDRCRGTLTRLAARPRTARAGVRDRVRRRTVRLRAGGRHLAQPRAARGRNATSAAPGAR